MKTKSINNFNFVKSNCDLTNLTDDIMNAKSAAEVKCILDDYQHPKKKFGNVNNRLTPELLDVITINFNAHKANWGFLSVGIALANIITSLLPLFDISLKFLATVMLIIMNSIVIISVSCWSKKDNTKYKALLEYKWNLLLAEKE